MEGVVRVDMDRKECVSDGRGGVVREPPARSGRGVVGAAEVVRRALLARRRARRAK